MTIEDRNRLIVVDDEADVRELLDEYLTRQGFEVRTAANAAALDALLAAEGADLILLDIGMPGEDGLSLTRRLRRTLTTPIIIVSGVNDVIDRVVGLEVGADDYVSKPFDLRELRARIRSLIRRSALSVGAEADKAGDRQKPRFGRFRLDIDAARLIDDAGGEEAMTPSEFQLLRLFAENPNRVLSRDLLLEQTSGAETISTARSIDIRIARLRARIELDPEQPRVIRTVRGAGYVYVPG